MATPTITGYLALGSALSAGNVLTEISGNGYARQAVTLYYDPASQTISLPDGVTFGPGTGTGTAASYVAIFDASTNGNMLLVWTQPEPALASGTSITYPATAPLIQVSNNLLALTGGATKAQVPAGASFGTVSLVGAIPAATVPVIAGVALTYSGGTLTAASSVIALTYAATITADVSQFNPLAIGLFSLTATGNVTTFSMINGVNGQEVILYFKQDATGSRTVTTWTNVQWASATAPTLTTTAAATDVLRFTWNATLGKWLGETVAKAIG